MQKVRRPIDTSQYFLFVRRVLAGTARRAQQMDPEDLSELLLLREDLDDAIHMVVNSLRASGATWDDIGAALNTTRQAAQQRWGHPRAARR